MNKRLLILAMLITLPLLGHAQTCRYEKEIAFALDASSAQDLRVDVGAGDLIIQGDSGTTDVRLAARACTDTESVLDDLQVRQRVSGSQMEIWTEFGQEERGFFFWTRSSSSRIDVELTVPAALALRVDDSSGDTTISGVASLDLEDGAGSVRISDIAADVVIEDGSGSLTVTRVSGRVTIEDGSGNLRVEDSDSVHIIDDGSGNIRISDIAGDVRIDDDGSGGIDVRNVGGDVDIGDSGSGGVSVDNVAGDYRLDSE